MQRIVLPQEDQKVVNRWRLVALTIYSAIGLALVVFVALSPALRDGGSSAARTGEVVRPLAAVP
jgi:hypothetical protein